MRSAFAVLAFLFLAAPVAADDRGDIRRVVEAQISAFAAGDARAAFGLASPEIQGRFGSSTMFMTMVENAYSQLIRPKAFDVRSVQQEGDRALLLAEVVAGDGGAYEAAYALRRQPGGPWRIDGCYLRPKPGQTL